MGKDRTIPAGPAAGKSTSDGFTNSACTVVVLVGVAVAAVRLRRLRRQERKAQRQDTL